MLTNTLRLSAFVLTALSKVSLLVRVSQLVRSSPVPHLVPVDLDLAVLRRA